MSKSLLIFGYGFSGQAIASAASPHCDDMFGTTRSVEKMETIHRDGVTAVQFDGTSLSEELRHRLAKTTHLAISIAPGASDPVLTAMDGDLGSFCPGLEWVGYLSTVGVYGNHDGEWVDEETAPKPVSERSLQRLAAEQAWQIASDAAGVPLAIFRLSGIYGPGRNAFVTIRNGRSRRLVKPGQVFNRIHRDDIGKAFCLAMERSATGMFNITDNEPAPPQDVVTYAHELMGLEPPPEINFETADLSPMARSFYGENKRVSNRRSKEVLGMQYDWPDYRTSLARMWREGTWQ